MQQVVRLFGEASQLFGEAWEQRRRRHRTIAASLLLIVLAGGAGVLIGRAGSPPTKRVFGDGYRFESASRVLTRHNVVLIVSSSFKGVREIPVVVLKSPATSIVASVGGRVIELRPFKSKVAPPNTAFSGSQAPAAHGHPVFTRLPLRGRSLNVAVRLLITYGNGSRVATEFRNHYKLGRPFTSP